MTSSRTLVALGLTVAAIALPAAAWFAVGSREAGFRAAQLRAEPRRAARATAERLAARLAEQLEQIRLAESDRPAPEYQNLYHDPRGATQGAAVAPSPLARGPEHPWILAHFQTTPDGAVTLPTVNDELPEANFVPDPAGQRALLDQLRPALVTCGVAVPADAARQAAAPIGQQVEAPPPARVPARQTPGVPTDDAALPANPRYEHTDGDSVRVQRLTDASWQQNRGANAIWSTVKGGQTRDPASPPPPSRLAQPPGPAAAPRQVEIRSGPLAWRVVGIDGLGPSLVAVRWVAWPDGTATQGLVIDRRRLDALGAESPLPARIVAAPPPDAEAVAIAPLAGIPGGPWFVAVATGDAVAAADRDATRLVTAFHRSFALGLSAALCAGLCVVALVWRTERLAAERAQFAAAAAHELRTPLAGLRMYGEMLAEGLGDPQRRDQYARRVADEAERLGRVVANVLEFTRLERGTLRVQAAPHDLSAVVATAVARQQPALHAASCPVETDLPAEPVTATCDPDAVTQIVQNLLDNAEKYSRGAPERRIRVAVTAREGHARVTVTDNGPGVSARVRGRLFRPFARTVDPDAPAGLGLGLALTRALARAQGGDVTHADAPGGGAAFTLALPAAAPPAVTMPA